MQIKKSKLPLLEMQPADILALSNKLLNTGEIVGIAGFIGLNIALFVLMVAFC